MISRSHTCSCRISQSHPLSLRCPYHDIHILVSQYPKPHPLLRTISDRCISTTAPRTPRALESQTAFSQHRSSTRSDNMARVTRARYKEIQQEERDLQRNRTRFSWKEEIPKTPSRQQRYAIPAGAHFQRAVAPPRYAGSESSDDDSENSNGKFSMYIEATPTPPQSRKTSPRSPAEFIVVNDSEIFKNIPLEVCVLHPISSRVDMHILPPHLPHPSTHPIHD